MRSQVMPTLLVTAVVLAACGDSSSEDAMEPAVSAPSADPVTTDPPGAESTAPTTRSTSQSSTAPTAAPTTEPTAAASVTAAETSGSTAPASSAPSGEAVPISSVCDLLTTDDLRNNPFFVDEPVAAGNDYGDGFLECVWEGDFEPHEVRVSVIPLAAWEEDFSAAEPLDLMGEDIGGGELYDTLLGIGRVGRGTTAVYFVGDQAILTAVRTGEDGSLAVDRSFAVDLGRRIVDQL